MVGDGDGLCATADAELGQHVGHVHADRLRADEERSPTCRLVRPLATRRSTSSSRSVRTPTTGRSRADRAGPAGPGSGRRRPAAWRPSLRPRPARSVASDSRRRVVARRGQRAGQPPTGAGHLVPDIRRRTPRSPPATAAGSSSPISRPYSARARAIQPRPSGPSRPPRGRPRRAVSMVRSSSTLPRARSGGWVAADQAGLFGAIGQRGQPQRGEPDPAQEVVVPGLVQELDDLSVRSTAACWSPGPGQRVDGAAAGDERHHRVPLPVGLDRAAPLDHVGVTARDGGIQVDDRQASRWWIPAPSPSAGGAGERSPVI